MVGGLKQKEPPDQSAEGPRCVRSVDGEEPAGLAVDRDDATLAVDALEAVHLLEVVGDLQGVALLARADPNAGFSEPGEGDHDVLAVVDVDELDSGLQTHGVLLSGVLGFRDQRRPPVPLPGKLASL